MSFSIDLTGQRFGKLTVLYRDGTYKTEALWFCLCDCGNTKTIKAGNLKNGTFSCGCHRIKHCKTKFITHGLTNTSIYKCWTSMKSRCLNPYDPSYRFYGAKGVTVCVQWIESFETFFADMGQRPSKKHSIDRIDSSGNYEPKNCRWVTTVMQNQNLRSNINITYNGETLCCAEWSRRLGSSHNIVSRRLKIGWDKEKAVNTPLRKSY